MTKPSFAIAFSGKEKVVTALCLHYCILSSLAELEQLKRGLTFQKFNLLMEEHPGLLRSAFHPPKIEITSDFIQDLFELVYYPKGSNQRLKEEEIVFTWIQYLKDIEGEVEYLQVIMMFYCATGSQKCNTSLYCYSIRSRKGWR